MIRVFTTIVAFFLVGLKEKLYIVVSRALKIELIRKALAFLAKRYLADNVVFLSSFFYERSQFLAFLINFNIPNHFFLDDNLFHNRLFDFFDDLFHDIHWYLYYFLNSPLTSLIDSFLDHFNFLRRRELIR